MILNKLRLVPSLQLGFASNRLLVFNKYVLLQSAQLQEMPGKAESAIRVATPRDRIVGEIFPTARVVPMVLTNKEPVILSFDDVPGPKSLKYLSSARSYLSEVGTQITASVLTLGLNIGM